MEWAYRPHPGGSDFAMAGASLISDVTAEAWAFCAPYLTLMKEDAPQREYPLRDLFNALRWLVRAGCSWRMLPHDLPLWHAVQQQTQHWVRVGCFEAMAADLRAGVAVSPIIRASKYSMTSVKRRKMDRCDSSRRMGSKKPGLNF